ncbi:MAG: lysylphosphatidylglycerol synthase transmembrane domain-containing protein [Bacteroidota bacterium]
MSRTLQYILSAFLSLVFLFFAFRGTDFGQLAHSMEQADYAWLFISLLCLFLSHIVRAYRWRYLLDPVKPSIGLRNLFSAVMIGYFMNNVLPRAGELARPYALSRMESLPASSAFGTVVMERLLDVMMFLVLVAILPLVYSGSLAVTFPWIVPSGIIISVIIFFAFAGIVILLLRPSLTARLLTFSARFLPRWISDRMGKLVHAFLDGFRTLTQPGRLVAITLLSFGVWFLYAEMTYTAFFAFHLQDRLDFASSIVVLTVASVGVAIPTPGGTGSYHVLVSQALTKLYGVDAPTALSYATLTHAFSFIAVSIVGAYYLSRDHVTFSDAIRPPGKIQ